LDTDDRLDAQRPTQDQSSLSWRPGEDLTPLEEEMVARVAVGEPVDRGDGLSGLEEMRAWSEDRTVRAAVLRHMLIGDQWPADVSGVRLSGVRISGVLDLKAATLRCPLSLNACYLDASEPICLDYATVSLVALTACQLLGLTADMITAKALDLAHSTFAGPLRCTCADISGGLNCRGANFTRADSNGSAIIAEGMRVGGDVYLDGGFTAAGAIQLRNVAIGGLLSCHGASLTGSDSDGSCLMAQGLRSGGSVFLDGGFTATAGAVRFHSAAISGVLHCRGAQLTGSDHAGYSLVADAMTTTGDVVLDQGFTAAGAVRVPSADIGGQLNCRSAVLAGRDSHGCSLVAEGMKTGGHVLLDRGFNAAGSVWLPGADIGGQLNCRSAVLAGRDSNGCSLVAEGMKTGTHVFLDREFTAAGTVLLIGAEITGRVICRGARLDGRDEDGLTLIADGINVGEGVILDDLTAAGAVSLVGAVIARQLGFTGARLSADNAGYALVADEIKVGGDIILNDVIAAGAIRLSGADIARALACSGASLNGSDQDNVALQAGGVKIASSVYLNKGFTCSGKIRLRSARIHGSVYLEPRMPTTDVTGLDATHAQIDRRLRWNPPEPVMGEINLQGMSVDELDDNWDGDRNNGFWPTGGKLRLDGFTYNRFGGDQQATVGQRLDWICSQFQSPGSGKPRYFATQPYEQLAKVYRQAGKDSDARKVAIARRIDLRRYGSLSWYRKVGSWFMDKTIKFGYQTWRAALGLVIVFVAFLVMTLFAQQHHAIVPVSDLVVGVHPVPVATQCAPSYPCFYPFGYAVDVVIPVINVHQADFWGLHGWGWVIGSWAATVLGWAAVTLLVVGYTGLVRQH
jgi:hypothetical protein